MKGHAIEVPIHNSLIFYDFSFFDLSRDLTKKGKITKFDLSLPYLGTSQAVGSIERETGLTRRRCRGDVLPEIESPLMFMDFWNFGFRIS